LLDRNGEPARGGVDFTPRRISGEAPAASSMSAETPQHYKLCSECKKPIAFSADSYRCSVSTCNRKRLGLFFCSVPCWDAHVPMMRHRDAWAEPTKAPTREQYLAELAEDAEAESRQNEREASRMEGEERGRRIVGLSDDDLPKDVLVVVSKLKNYVRARSGMSTSDGVIDVLSAHLRKLCDRAIEHAGTAGRKTVMDRDFEAILKKD
jgi:histone H3/H4